MGAQLVFNQKIGRTQHHRLTCARGDAPSHRIVEDDAVLFDDPGEIGIARNKTEARRPGSFVDECNCMATGNRRAKLNAAGFAGMKRVMGHAHL